MSNSGPIKNLNDLNEDDKEYLLSFKRCLEKNPESDKPFSEIRRLLEEDFEYQPDVLEFFISELSKVERPDARPVTAADLSARLDALIIEGEADLNRDAATLAKVGKTQAAIVRQMQSIADSLEHQADANAELSRVRP